MGPNKPKKKHERLQWWPYENGEVREDEAVTPCSKLKEENTVWRETSSNDPEGYKLLNVIPRTTSEYIVRETPFIHHILLGKEL